jgi:two-component sensor histidine kinase
MTAQFQTPAGPSFRDFRHRRWTLRPQAAEPRDVVLEEMNHRWFNALQVLSNSLKSLRRPDGLSATLDERVARIDFQIRAMAALHRRLARPPAQNQTLETYCHALCIDLLLAFGREEIRPWVTMGDIAVSPATSVRVGALVVELLTNALKHGRAPAEGGAVWISMRRLGGGRLELTAADSFPAPTEEAVSPRMIEGLVARLGGDLSVQTETGYMTRIRFPAS